MSNRIISLFVFIAIVLMIGIIGSYATSLSLDNWYGNLQKPTWTPPTWMFSTVWTFLYFLIGLSGWLVWDKVKGTGDLFPMKVYALQLFLNALWPWLFFGMQNVGLAFLDLILLFFVILYNMAVFWKYSPVASLLFLPYIIWSFYALALNFVIFLYNEMGIGI